MENKHGLNQERINFCPISDEEIKKYDIIGSDNLKHRLYCIEKDVFIIVTPEPENTYLTDEDLKLKFKIIDGTANGK